MEYPKEVDMNGRWTGRDSSIWTDDPPWDRHDPAMMAVCRFLRGTTSKGRKRSPEQIAQGTRLPLRTVLEVLAKRLALSRDRKRDDASDETA